MALAVGTFLWEGFSGGAFRSFARSALDFFYFDRVDLGFSVIAGSDLSGGFSISGFLSSGDSFSALRLKNSLTTIMMDRHIAITMRKIMTPIRASS